MSLRAFALFSAAFFVFAAPAPGRGGASSIPRTIIVSLEGEGRLAVLDAVTLRILTSIRVGPGPHNLAAVGRDLVLVANQGGRSISIVNVMDAPESQRVELGAVPHDVLGFGHQGYVLSPDRKLVVLDLQTNRVTRRVSIGVRPHNLALANGQLWLTDIGQPAIVVLDARIGSSPGRLPLPSPGHDLALRPGSRELWITPWRGNQLTIADVQSRKVLGTARIGSSPQHLAFSEDGREVWITETSTSAVYVLDAPRRRVLRRISLPGPPHHVAVDPARAYIASGPEHLVVVDRTSRTVTKRVSVGRNPHDIVVLGKE